MNMHSSGLIIGDGNLAFYSYETITQESAMQTVVL